MRLKNTFLILYITLLLPALAACSAAPQTVTVTNPPEPLATLALVNGTLIDGTGADPVLDAVVLINNDLIVAAGPRTSVTVPEGVKTIDLGGATIMPGFINAHVHSAFDESLLKEWAQGGVTTVRDEAINSSLPLAELMAFRDKVNANSQYARLVSAGYMITVPDGYGQMFVTSTEDARKKVLEEINAGVDLVKISMEDGYAGTSGLPKLTDEERAEIIKTAHENGLLVSGHITQAEYMKILVNDGVDDIAHIPYTLITDDVLKQTVEKGIYITPTFSVFHNYGAPVTTCVQNLLKFVKLGGLVALGNDYGGGPGDFEVGIPMYEIEMMQKAEMTPMQIIVASTKNAAHVSGLDNILGTLEAGKIADILVVGGNPLADLQALTDIRLVVHNGTIIRDETE